MYGNAGAAGAAGVFILLAIIIIPAVFFLIMLQRTIEECSVENRTITPGSVWLMFIPLFNFVWQFILVIRVSETLHNEFVKRNISTEPAPGKTIGLTTCILGVCSIIPLIGFIFGIASFITWILYWVKIAGYSSRLKQPVVAG